MTTISTIADLLTHLGIADARPADINVYESAKLHEWLRMAWNHGAAAKKREMCNECQQARVQEELDAKENEAEDFRLRCRALLAKAKRAKRD